MKYCQKCGKIYQEHISTCPSCNCDLALIQESCLNSNITYFTYPKISVSTLVFAAVFPWLGLMLYMMYRKTQPDNASRIRNAILIYFFIMLLISIFMIKALWR